MPDLGRLFNHIPGYIYDSLNNSIITNYSIASNLQLAHFLAQCNYESGNFIHAEENLNYSAEALLATFPSYFDEDTASQYARHPEKIANLVYANRYGNGDETSGDGWRYRGRGFIQLTFKDNYQSYSDFTGQDVINNPDRVANEFPLDSAAYFFKQNGLFEKSDEGNTYDIVEYITRRVSGKKDTAPARYTIFLNYYGLLTGDQSIVDRLKQLITPPIVEVKEDEIASLKELFIETSLSLHRLKKVLHTTMSLGGAKPKSLNEYQGLSPKPIPSNNPILFAIEPSAGCFWPVKTQLPEGRMVSYEATNNQIIGREGRRFLAEREDGRRYHVAIDLFGSSHEPVYACEDGIIIEFEYFYDASNGERTYCLLVQHSTVIINYGEVRPDSLDRNHLTVGSRVTPGQQIGFIGGTNMLHFETYSIDPTSHQHLPQRWMTSNPNPPSRILNPTKYLLYLQEFGS